MTMHGKSKRVLQILLYSAVALVGYRGVEEFCKKQTDGFSVHKISSQLPYNESWEYETQLTQEEQKKILSQTFHYLGFGGQCFAFVSEDGQYVIKLLQLSHYRSLLPQLLPLPLHGFIKVKFENKIAKKKKKFDRDFTSYSIAIQELKEETGLLMIHLNKTDAFHAPLTIVDKLGIFHKMDIDSTSFIMQKKADLVYPKLLELKKENNHALAAELIHSLIELNVNRCQKGIYDEDARIHRNFGFVGSRAIVIDVGRFRRDEKRKDPSVCRRDIESMTSRFSLWLLQQYPEMVPILEKEINAL